MNLPLIALATKNSRVIDVAQAAAAAAGRPLTVVDQPSDVHSLWRRAQAILIGGDLVEDIAGLALPPRHGIFLVGTSDENDRLCAWSMPLSATVVSLPEGARWLSRVFFEPADPADEPAEIVALIGGAGGVGVSTLAAGLSIAVGKTQAPTAVVDLDMTGGGIDLVFGAEAADGWRWDKLTTASGQMADITAHLPRSQNVTLVSMPRELDKPVPASAVRAVIDCLARSHRFIVLDLGHSPVDLVEDALAVSTRQVVVTGTMVRHVAATRSLVKHFPRRWEVIVRQTQHGSLAPGAICEALGMPLLGVLPENKRLALAADQGIPPTMAGRRWDQALRSLVNRLAPDLAGFTHHPANSLGLPVGSHQQVASVTALPQPGLAQRRLFPPASQMAEVA
jgi:secretion/DNA translocation related CpaE-like protein